MSIMCHDLSNNALGRAWVLARLSQDDYEVELVGPALTGKVWEPLAEGSGFPIRVLDARRRRHWAREIDGDVLVAVKPRLDSLTLALRASQYARRPVVADVDDWEMAFFYDYPARMAKQLLALTSPRNFYRTLAAERSVRRADAVAVSSTWLQNRFGGAIIPHARDTSIFDPAHFDRAAARERLGVADDDIVVMFVGTVMKHKGVDLIIEAMARTGRTDLVLASPGDLLPAKNGLPRTTKLPRVSLAELPGILVASDLVVLPQRKSRSSNAQIPAKVFDALAMGLPVVTSDVSDLREIVGSGGIAVPPDDVDAMSAAIDRLASDTSLRQQMSAEARARCVEYYSEDALKPRWLRVVADAERRAAGEPN